MSNDIFKEILELNNMVNVDLAPKMGGNKPFDYRKAQKLVLKVFQTMKAMNDLLEEK